MTIAIKTCPHCGVQWTENYRIGIGRPYYRCSTCAGYVIDKDDNEWALKSPVAKVGYILILFWTAIVAGFLPVLVAVLVLGESGAESHLLSLWVAGFLSVAAMLAVKNLKSAKASNERMKDPDYRRALKEMGLLRRRA